MKKGELRKIIREEIRNLLKEKKKLSVPEKHKEKIAKDTLRMPNAMVGVMGGMDKKEAKKFLKSIGYTDKQIKKLEENYLNEQSDKEILNFLNKELKKGNIKITNDGLLGQDFETKDGKLKVSNERTGGFTTGKSYWYVEKDGKRKMVGGMKDAYKVMYDYLKGKNEIREASKPYGGDEPDFESWSQSRVEKYWKTFKKNHPEWEDKVEAASKFSDNPEGFVATLQKKATGKWPSEK